MKPKPKKFEAYDLDELSDEKQKFLRETFRRAGRPDGSIDGEKLTALDRARFRRITGDEAAFAGEALSREHGKVRAEMPVGLSTEQTRLLREVFSTCKDLDGNVDFQKLSQINPLAAVRAARLLGRHPLRRSTSGVPSGRRSAALDGKVWSRDERAEALSRAQTRTSDRHLALTHYADSVLEYSKRVEALYKRSAKVLSLARRGGLSKKEAEELGEELDEAEQWRAAIIAAMKKYAEMN